MTTKHGFSLIFGFTKILCTLNILLVVVIVVVVVVVVVLVVG